MIHFRIEDAALPYIDDKTHEILQLARNQDQARVYISGQPMSIWGIDGQDQFFDDCPIVMDTPMTIGRLALFRVPRTGHDHIPVRFTPDTDYACLQGFDAAGNEYRMGMLHSLGFEVRNIIC